MEELVQTHTAVGRNTKHWSEFVVLYNSLCCLITNETVKITNSMDYRQTLATSGFRRQFTTGVHRDATVYGKYLLRPSITYNVHTQCTYEPVLQFKSYMLQNAFNKTV